MHMYVYVYIYIHTNIESRSTHTHMHSVPSHGFFNKYPQALDDLETAAHQVRLRLDWKHATGG